MRRTPTVLVLLGGVLLAACGQGEPPTDSVATAAVPVGAVPHDGDTVSGSGRLVREPGGPVLFCGSEAKADVGYEPGSEPAPVACRDGVPVQGADLSTVKDRFEKAGAVEGYATITGTWRGGAVEVREQGWPALPADREPEPAPCPEPEGGWPHTAEGDNMDAEQKRVSEDGRVRVGQHRFALLRPSQTQVLLGYAVPDEQARSRAQAALDELVPDRACAVVARHTDAQVEAARAVDWSSFDGVRGHGIGLRRMQAVLHVWVLVVTEPVAAEAARHPDGLVELVPDLRVVERGTAPAAPEPTAAPGTPSASPSPASAGPSRASPSAASPASPGPSAAAGSGPVSGRGESLDCGSDDRSSTLVVDHPADAAGHATPQAAAHALADDNALPRGEYTERPAEDPLGQPVFEYLDSDGRVVAYVTVGQWTGDTWMASGLTACHGAYPAG